MESNENEKVRELLNSEEQERRTYKRNVNDFYMTVYNRF